MSFRTQLKVFGIMAFVVVVALFACERSLPIKGEQFEALRSLCESHGGIDRVVYNLDADAETFGLTTLPVPKRVVCKDKSTRFVPRSIQKMSNK
ncbi:MAG: hypothetical protein HYT93_03190 [Parcubacteria group bacterium]|nr:hypothetical protein [Parcubacteria group bacterium]